MVFVDLKIKDFTSYFWDVTEGGVESHQSKSKFTDSFEEYLMTLYLRDKITKTGTWSAQSLSSGKSFKRLAMPTKKPVRLVILIKRVTNSC